MSQKETSTRTAPGLVLGTVGYLSPEQARRPGGRRAVGPVRGGDDPLRDAFGAAGVPGETAADTDAAILHQEPPEIVSGEGPIPPGLERVVRRCLEKDPRSASRARGTSPSPSRRSRGGRAARPWPSRPRLRWLKWPALFSRCRRDYGRCLGQGALWVAAGRAYHSCHERRGPGSGTRALT